MSVHLYTSPHFPLTAYCGYTSGDMAMSDRACLDLLPGLTTGVRNFACLQIKHSLLFDGQFIEVRGSDTGPRADRTPCMRQLLPSPVSKKRLIATAAKQTARSIS